MMGVAVDHMQSFALHFRQITTPAPYHSIFYRPDALPATQPEYVKYYNTTNLKYIIDVSTSHLRSLRWEVGTSIIYPKLVVL